MAMLLWFRGSAENHYDVPFHNDNLRNVFYCVDLSVDDLFLQREIRLSNKPQSINHQQSNIFNDGNPVFLKKRDKLGLQILPESIPFSPPNIDVRSSTILTLGSFIYCTGGYIYNPGDLYGAGRRQIKLARLSKNLYCFDTKNQHEGWKTFKMITGRIQPLMAAIDGKIYIMGGKRDPSCRFSKSENDDDDDGYNDDDGETGPWGEVFDPATGKTDPIPDIPDEFLDDSLPIPDEFVDKQEYRHRPKVLEEWNIVVFTNENSIVLCSGASGRRIFYEINKQNWSSIVVDKMLATHLYLQCNNISKQGCVFVGSTIYWISGDLTVSAFDFTTSRLYNSGDIQQYFFKGWKSYYAATQLIHLSGNDFCIVWAIGKPDRDYPNKWAKLRRQINCTKLKIRCIDNSDGSSESLSVSMLYSHIYVVDLWFDIWDALLVGA